MGKWVGEDKSMKFTEKRKENTKICQQFLLRSYPSVINCSTWLDGSCKGWWWCVTHYRDGSRRYSRIGRIYILTWVSYLLDGRCCSSGRWNYFVFFNVVFVRSVFTDFGCYWLLKFSWDIMLLVTEFMTKTCQIWTYTSSSLIVRSFNGRFGLVAWLLCFGDVISSVFKYWLTSLWLAVILNVSENPSII